MMDDPSTVYKEGWRDGYAQAIKDIQGEHRQLWHQMQRAHFESLHLDEFINDKRRQYPTVVEVVDEGPDPY